MLLVRPIFIISLPSSSPSCPETEKLLQSLPGWDLDDVKFNESNACLYGTRQQLLDDIREWVHSPDGGSILWISGGAGTGKSSVAHSIAIFFDGLGRLGACFCFNRDTAGLNSPKNLFGNLCYQLAHFDSDGPLKKSILAVIGRMGHIAGSSLQTQAKKLIVDTTNATELLGPIVLVIDALDEAGTIQTRKPLLEAIAKEFRNFPPTIKVIVTSRDEPDIRASLRGCSNEKRIEETEKTVEDIASYIQHRLVEIKQHSHLRPDWPGPEKLQELYNRAGHLFIWASVACNFIEDGRDTARRLIQLLDATSGKGTTASPLSKLDMLYTSILENAFPPRDGRPADFHHVVGSIIALEVPLTSIELDSLLGFGDEYEDNLSDLPGGNVIHLSSSSVIIDSLRSILTVDSTTQRGKDGAVRLLHPSLYDFLTGPSADNFQIDITKQNEILAIRCLNVMNSQLEFDICKTGDPSLLNKEIEDLSGKIDQYVSGGLRYSCCSFACHIANVLDLNAMLVEALKEFVCEHLLHWMEIMSLLEEVSKAEECLYMLASWMKVGLYCLLHDDG